MSRPYWKARHVESRSLLPEKLDRGRAYFVDDEQIIIIDHGNGPIEYGGKPGPQGIPGEPIPSLQGQIDDLTEASLRTSFTLFEINQRRKIEANHIREMLNEVKSIIAESDNNNASALMAIVNLINQQEEKRDAEIAILTKAITALYPPSHSGIAGDETNNTPTGEIITASDGSSYIIEQSYIDNGTGVIVVSFYEPQTIQRINTLKEGDIITIDSHSYTVMDTDTFGGKGVIVFTVSQA